MTESVITSPTAEVLDVEDLVKKTRSGSLRIPDFQRPLRWGVEDARRLFDSILHGYPLGSLLLWRRPAARARIRLGALEIDAPELDHALWVVDGQQRLTTLANTLTEEGTRDERFALSVDLVTRQVVPTRPGLPATVVPLYVLFDLQKLLGWFRDHPEVADHLDDASAITKTIRQTKIPASIVDTTDEGVLRDIFDRLNNYGKRLTRAEVFAALHPGPDSSAAGSVDVLGDIAAAVDREFGFGLIDSDTVLRAVLARRGPDVTREIRREFDGDRGQLGDFPGESVEGAYQQGEAALRRAVRFLQSDVDVPHFGFLPYRYLLIVLTRVFARGELTSPRQRRLLRRWFWRAASAGPNVFPGSTTGTTRAYCNVVDVHDTDGSLARLLAAVPARSPFPEVSRFRSNTATGKIMACALWGMRPRSLKDGSEYSHADLAEVVAEAVTPAPALTEIISKRGLPEQRKDSLARRLLAPGIEYAPAEVVGVITGFHAMTDELWVQTLASHGIDADADQLLQSGDAVGFVNRRSEFLQREVDSFLERRWESEFEDSADLSSYVIDDLDVPERDVPEPDVAESDTEDRAVKVV